MVDTQIDTDNTKLLSHGPWWIKSAMDKNPVPPPDQVYSLKKLAVIPSPIHSPGKTIDKTHNGF